MSRSKPVRAVFVALFFATGLTGLGFQVLWAKQFAAGAGHEFAAVLAVITAYMGGIAAGAAFYGKSRLLQHSPATYGCLELLIGFWAAATIFLVPSGTRGAIMLLGPTVSPAAHSAIVFLLVFLILLPATAAMGATFPAIERLFESFSSPRQVAILYAANTAGAMAGALISAFILMPRFGISWSVCALALLNVLSGAVAIALTHRTKTNSRTAEPEISSSSLRPLALQLVATGFLGIGFETVMIRGLSQVLENTVFTFAALLATYLGATALGAALVHRVNFTAASLFLATALLCSLGGLLLWATPDLYPILRKVFGDSIAGVAAAETLTTALVMFAPALGMGGLFATLAQASLNAKPNLSWSLALNTAGAAAAPACFGSILLPTIGLKGTLSIIAVGYIVLTVTERTQKQESRAKKNFRSFPGIGWPIWARLAPVALAVFFFPSTADLVRLQPGERIVFHREDALASTAVLENTNGARVLKVNNRFQMGGTAARTAEERHAYLPILLHPEPRSALVIGLGTGISFGAATHFPELQVDGVELLPSVVKAMPFFQEDSKSSVAGNPRILIADGRRFVLSTRQQYDVIIADLFHPAQDGAGFLYTAEHFAAIRAKLKPSGLFCQWLPLFQLDLETFKIIARTFLDVFPDGQAWLLRFNVDTPVIGLIGGPTFGPREWPANQGLQESLRQASLNDPVRLFGCHLANGHDLARFASGAPLNTDDHPMVMFRAPTLAFQKQDDPGARLLALMEQLASTNAPQSAAPALAQRVQKFKTARDLYLRALVLEKQGQPAKATALYLEGTRLSPDFTASYAQLLTIATAFAKENPEFSRRLLADLDAARPEVPVARQLRQRLFPNAP